MRVFFDASVIIAALLSQTGGSSLLLLYVKQGIINGITSQTVIDEITEEDKLDKLNKSRKEIEEFVAKSEILVRERINPQEIESYKDKINIEDAHLFAGANITGCNYLVSLDKKHVLHKNIKELFLPLRVVSPKELLEDIMKIA